jgi:DNA-binding NtrC family response regulator
LPSGSAGGDTGFGKSLREQILPDYATQQFTPAGLRALLRYTWQRKACQFENEVTRLVASVRGKVIAEEHLDPSIRNAQEPAALCKRLQLPHSQHGPRPGGDKLSLKPSKPWNEA